MKPLLIGVSLFLNNNAQAHDWGADEGRFVNRSDRQLACYGDDREHPGQVCRRIVKPGQACRGDAIGVGDGGRVFKVPNRSEFVVNRSLTVRPGNVVSALLIDGAKIKNGARKYGLMSWSHFIQLMGNREVVACESNQEKRCE